jgi:hypothetical protein
MLGHPASVLLFLLWLLSCLVLAKRQRCSVYMERKKRHGWQPYGVFSFAFLLLHTYMMKIWFFRLFISSGQPCKINKSIYMVAFQTFMLDFRPRLQPCTHLGRRASYGPNITRSGPFCEKDRGRTFSAFSNLWPSLKKKSNWPAQCFECFSFFGSSD